MSIRWIFQNIEGVPELTLLSIAGKSLSINLLNRLDSLKTRSSEQSFSLGMFTLTALSSIWTKGNPVMMLGMGGFSLLTAATTMSQYFEEKKDTKEQEKSNSRL